MIKTLARAFVRLVSVLVPAGYRDRFVDEWRAELYYEPDSRRALGRSVGALRDAMATRTLVPSHRGRPTPMLFQDVRFALRSFLHRPWWTAVVLLMLHLVEVVLCLCSTTLKNSKKTRQKKRLTTLPIGLR